MGCIGENCQVIEFSVRVDTKVFGGNCGDDAPPPKDDRIAAAIVEQLETDAAPSGCDRGCHCVKATNVNPTITVEEQDYDVTIPGPHCEWTVSGKCTVTTTNTPGLCSKNKKEKHEKK